MKKFTEALETPCQTPDAQFHIKIEAEKISIEVDMPKALELSAEDAELLDKNLHNAVELVLARYFA